MSAGSPTPPPRPRKQRSLAQALREAQPRSQKKLNALRKRKLTDDVDMRGNDPMQRGARKPRNPDPGIRGPRGKSTLIPGTIKRVPAPRQSPRSAWRNRNHPRAA